MWQHVIHFLTSPHAPYVFCGILGVIFILSLLDGVLRIGAVLGEIGRASRLLKAVPDRSAFYGQFETLADQFAKIPLFARAWAEFSKTVIIDTDRELVRITRRPHEFFHERSLLNPRLNTRQYLAMPGYLISLGLFFTFIGLVAAIAVAASGLHVSNDVEHTQAALVQLLDVASLKFISSVAGISLSVVLAFLQKMLLGAVSRAIHRFCDAVEAHTQLVTTEQLLHQWLSANAQTTRNMAHLADDIATEVLLQLKPGQQHG